MRRIIAKSLGGRIHSSPKDEVTQRSNDENQKAGTGGRGTGSLEILVGKCLVDTHESKTTRDNSDLGQLKDVENP
jgi:hypothetical protein